MNLAVITPEIGQPSETFIRRHILELSEHAVPVVYKYYNSDLWWEPEAEALCIEKQSNRMHWRMRRLARKCGYKLSLCPVDDWKRVDKFLKKQGVDTLLIEYLNQFVDWVPHAVSAGYRVVAHGHGIDMSAALKDKYQCQRYLEVYSRGVDLVVPSEFAKKRLIEIGLLKQQIHIIPYGVEVSTTPASQKKPGGPCRFLAVGRMVAKKSPIRMLESFRKSLERGCDVSLDYVGDGPLMSAVRDFVDVSGLKSHVTLHGKQQSEKVMELMNQADVFVQHSITDPVTGDQEGMPVAILEAMAHALPVVSTRHAGIPEAVINEESGLIVEEGDVDGMADGFVSLATDSNLRMKMGEAGQKRVSENFTWEHEKNKLFNLLSQS